VSGQAIARAGFVALVGRPNVGKSTLVNRLLGTDIAITSRRAQTTRHRLLGIHTAGGAQAVYVDTPGINPRGARALGRQLNRTAQAALEDVDLIAMVVQGTHWTPADEYVLARVREAPAPAVAIVNKVDLVHPKEALLPQLERLGALGHFREIVPVSARSGANMERLTAVVAALLPQGGPMFPPGQLTDRGPAFFAAEAVREQLMRHLGDELPYACTVEVEQLEEQPHGRTYVGAVVWVERAGHKAIVIGHGGQMLRAIGTEARHALARRWDKPVELRLHVKVRAGWTDDEAALRAFGYTDG
jgi:GTPase